MKTKFRMEPGLPQPKGATSLQRGVNFSIFSRHASSVALVIGLHNDSENDREIELELDSKINKTGDIWHILIHGLPKHFTYGYRLDGPYDPRGKGHYYTNQLVLVDPYARLITFSAWGQDRPSLGKKPCCMLPEVFYNWEGERITRIFKI